MGLDHLYIHYLEVKFVYKIDHSHERFIRSEHCTKA